LAEVADVVEVDEVEDAVEAESLDDAEEVDALDEADDVAELDDAEEVAELEEAEAAAGAAGGVVAMTPSISRKWTWRGIASKTSPIWRRLPAIFMPLLICLTTV
jgi:hypothetical protein